MRPAPAAMSLAGTTAALLPLCPSAPLRPLPLCTKFTQGSQLDFQGPLTAKNGCQKTDINAFSVSKPVNPGQGGGVPVDFGDFALPAFFGTGLRGFWFR